MLCVQWILFALERLTLLESYFAMQSRLSSRSRVDLDADTLKKDDIEPFLITCSKGMEERTSLGVRFIHESVRDFLLRRGGLSHLCQGESNVFEAEAHCQLARCCLSSLQRCLHAKSFDMPAIAHRSRHDVSHASTALASSSAVFAKERLGCQLVQVATQTVESRASYSVASADVANRQVMATPDRPDETSLLEHS